MHKQVLIWLIKKKMWEFSIEQQHKREEGLLNRRNQEAQFAGKKKRI